MPVNRLKLMAFAFGAAVAALTGTFATALNGSVFPQNFEFPLLITVYTMVILGGAGSQAGVVLGAVIVSVLLEALRDPGDSRGLFYVLIVLSLVAVFRTSLKLAVVVGGTVVFGVVARLVAGAIDDSWTTGPVEESGRLADWAADWVIVPARLAEVGRPGDVHLARRARAAADARQRLGADRAARADALPRGLRLGERDAPAARVDALHRPRRAARRDDDRAAAGAPRREARGDRLSGGAELLELRGVSMAFGGLSVVCDLDLHVDEGEIVSVIGPNGAGKTTLFNLVTGIYEPTEGDILFAGESIAGLDPHQITRKGIARTFQTLRLFLNMTVRENVMAAAYGHTRAGPAARSAARPASAARSARSARSPRSASPSSASG